MPKADLQPDVPIVGSGKRAADIAADLVVSQSTIRNHLSSIYVALRVDGQVDLIRTLRGKTASQ